MGGQMAPIARRNRAGSTAVGDSGSGGHISALIGNLRIVNILLYADGFLENMFNEETAVL
jgi:hypothetical protein